MPRQLPWVEIAYALSPADGIAFLDQLKTYKIVKSQPHPCLICNDIAIHATKYQLIECDSTICASPGMKCPWRGRILTCELFGRISVYELGAHITLTRSPAKKKKLTLQQKAYCRELAAVGLRPLRIRNGMRQRFKLGLLEVPSLRRVQNFANHFRRTKLDNHDDHDAITALVRAQTFTGREDEGVTFTFTWSIDTGGTLVVGDGSDQKPFIVGITTKNLLRRLDRPPESFVLHVDATFKLNQVDYPVLVVGISDICRSFHLVAVFVISQRVEAIYAQSLLALRRVYSAVAQKQLRLQYVMGYAEKSPRNAFEAAFPDANIEYLMCFYHVMVKVQERSKALPNDLANAVLAHVYNMQFTETELEFALVRDHCIELWKTRMELNTFREYFSATWLESKFRRWQCYHTPPGYATTNNPVEQFSRILKRDYTLRKRLKMGALLRQLRECCANEAATAQSFRSEPAPTASLLRRATQLAKDSLIEVVSGAVDTENVYHEICTLVKSRPAPRFYIPAKKRTVEYLAVTAQMGTHYARMEHLGQPLQGWDVNLERRICSCRYWLKFAFCIHVIVGLQTLGRLNKTGRRVLVNRSIARSKSVGRPTNNTQALSLQ